MKNTFQIMPNHLIVDEHRPMIHLSDEELAESTTIAKNLKKQVATNPHSAEILRMVSTCAVLDVQRELAFRN